MAHVTALAGLLPGAQLCDLPAGTCKGIAPTGISRVHSQPITLRRVLAERSGARGGEQQSSSSARRRHPL
jgi:hypothetical protein